MRCTPLTLLCLALVGACGGDPSDEGGDSSASTEAGATQAGSTATPATDDGTSGSGMTATTDAASGTTSASGSATSNATTDEDDSGTAETGPVCEPRPPAGNTCLECVYGSCCVAWEACFADEPCACVIDCHVIQGNSLGMCSNVCNLDSNRYQELFFCGEANCLGSCEWDCC